ncbi:MAG: HlyD family efflux transporter periplasmic adaptor subunit [Stomatobaculum sp.]
MASNSKKVVPYRRPFKINIGVIMFLILFIYLCFSVTSYLGRKKIRFYEVETGGMVSDREQTGIILRTENVQTAPASGYINHYIRNGKRAAIGTRIYSIDETGNLKQYLNENTENSVTLSEQNIKELKNRLSSFSAGYSAQSFTEVYNSRDAVQSVLSEYTSLNLLESLDETLKAQGISFTRVTSPESGVISFTIDSFEGKTPEQLSAADFKAENYHAVYISPGELAEDGAAVYKIIPSEDWQLVFPLREEDKAAYAKKTSLRTFFKSYDLTLTGDYSVVTGADGASYGVLTFHQYMVRFIDDRLLSFQIVSGSSDGLKIPRSSVAEKTFFTIPKAYLTGGGNSVEEGFLKEVYVEGNTGVVFTPTEIFYESEELCYIDISDKGAIKAGDYLVMPGSSERYQVNETAVLRGVYNINKGYAVFKQIDVIEENDEYLTVKRGTKYGLNVYDHILLDGAEGTEGEPVY